MTRKFTRRSALTAIFGSVAAVPLVPKVSEAQNEPPGYAPGRSEFWAPSPNKNRKRDLTPGTMTVRLGGYLTDASVDAATAANASPPPEPQLLPIAPGGPNGRGGRGGAGGTPPSLDQTIGIIQKLRAQGITAVRANPINWMSLSDSELAQLKAEMNRLDFEFVEVGTYLNPMHPDPTVRAGYIKRCIDNIEACERVGCRCIGVTAGSRYMPTMDSANNFAADPDNWTLASWKMSVDYFKQILKATAGMKTGIGIEANVTSILDTPLAHKNFIEDLADPRVVVVFDPSNSIHLWNYYYTTEMLDECFSMWGERINNLHGKDCYIEPRMQSAIVRQVTPGLGTLDYETLLVQLSRLRWARSITPEVAVSEWPATYAHIRKVAAQVGVKIHGA